MARRFSAALLLTLLSGGLAALILRQETVAAVALLALLAVAAGIAVLAQERRERELRRALAETRERFRLVAENTGEVVVRTGRDGRIEYASPGAQRLLGKAAGELTGRPLTDLAQPTDAGALTAAHDAAMSGQPTNPLELLAPPRDGDRQWLEAQLRAIVDVDGTRRGTVAIFRDIERVKALEERLAAERKAFEEQLFTASLTDPLTHLTNRHAFVSMLDYMVGSRMEGCLALFDIDYFKSINMQYGHLAGDRILMVFTDLVRTLVRSDDIVSRVGGGRFGILLPRATADRAEAVCQRIVAAMSDMRLATGDESLHITVSAGVSRIAPSLDETMRAAELALVIAKAKGRDRLELSNRPRLPWSPAPQPS